MSRNLSCWGTNNLKVTARTAPVIDYELWCGVQSKSGRMARIVARTAKEWLEREQRVVTTVPIWIGYSDPGPPSIMAIRLITLCTRTTWTLTCRARSGTNSVMALPMGSVAREIEMRAALAPKLCFRPGT
jgi:hypothetical protein